MSVAVGYQPAHKVEEPLAGDAGVALQLELQHRLSPLAMRHSAALDAEVIDRYCHSFAERLTYNTAYLRVIRQAGGLIVAFLDADIDTDSNRIGALHVACGHRGQGLGQTLLMDYEAAVLPGAAIQTEMPTADKQAQRFFRLFGYQPVQQRRVDRNGNQWLRMTKQLTKEVV